MTKEKKKWNTFKRLFSKQPEASPHPTPPPPTQPPPTQNPTEAKPTETFVIEPEEGETFVVDPESNDVFVIEPTQGETFVIEPTEEDIADFQSVSNDIFTVEPTKEYERLGLSTDVSDAEVKKRYRNLMKQNHPDVGGDASEFMKIRKAYLKIMESRTEGES